ncbi:MAG: hypothetical protein PHO26_05045 [Dehalococcoidia bacterium]|nr:hypothetical protein [Dehalococcoidia bacterium]MDD5494451.1 hypothetical protein [Dehalococcoidia bacterium]
MEPDDKIQYAIENTEVLRPPRQNLATFGTTNIYYYMITELMHEVNVIREGRVIAAKPKIITPAYLINIEGFSGPARRYIQMLAEKNPHEPGVFYSYKNEPREMNIISQPLPELVDKIYQRIDNQSDPLSTVIKGVEEMWDVSLLKFTFELTRNSVYNNVSEFYGRGLLNVDKTGVPRAARDNIEELFEIAGKDPSRAPELVSELRQWNLWSEYQDRFLRLFRKK